MRGPLAYVLVLLPFLASAQQWCPPGATWHFSSGSDSGPYNGYVRNTYTGDTLFSGQNAQKIFIEWSYFTWTPTPYFEYSAGTSFTYVQNEVLYCWYGPGGFPGPYWDTLIWFGAAPGDQWQVLQPGDFVCDCKYAVVDTGHTVIGGQSLRFVQTIMDCPDWLGLDSIRFVERIGSFRGLPWGECYIGAEDTILRCYEDVDMTLSTGIADSCDFINGLPSIRTTLDILLWPNPASDHLYISFRSTAPANGAFRLFDASGKQVRRFLPGGRSEEIDLDLRTHEPGLYVLVYQDGFGTRWSQRIVIE